MSQGFRQTFKAALARIYNANNVVVGAGFLVTERYLLTCAHVVTSALGLPTDTVEAPADIIEFDFPLLENGQSQRYKARVIFWSPVCQGKIGEDIAALEAESLPIGSRPVHLVSAKDVWQHSFEVFGFPSQREMGIWATGKLLDRNGLGWVQIEDIKAQGFAVEHGFSGSPIWDEQLEGVVGMAIAAERKREDAKVAFMMPVDVIGSVWAEIGDRVASVQAKPMSTDQTSFRQIKLLAKQERLSMLIEQWKLASNQLLSTLNDSDIPKLNKQLEIKEQEIEQLEAEITQLKDR
jgi:V8-like Glu-specific endopeptidase